VKYLIYVGCGCSWDFRMNWFGIPHWFKYTKLRYHWRNFWTRSTFYSIRVDGGKLMWHDYHGLYYSYPGPNMTNDEWRHWFGNDDPFPKVEVKL